MRRLLVRLLVALVVLVVAIVGLGYVYVRQSLPMLDGRVTVTGASGPIEIIRDADAIPHIIASTKPDALFGLGYVHAQDRLWQMEFQRRIGHGRLAEIFGGAATTQDRFLRTIGFGRAAVSAWERLDGETRLQIDAYLQGVNTFIATHHGRALPPEFTLLRFEPEPFTGPDVLVWVKMMAWDLSTNWSLEMMRHDIALKVGDARMAELLPPYPVDGLSIVPAVEGVPSGTPMSPPVSSSPQAGTQSATALSPLLLSAVSSGDGFVRDLLLGSGKVEAIGSNNWVVDGTLTASGKPLLANDPHLATHIPSLWYLAHMTAGEFDVIGATLPGAPAVALGRNRFIAWGATNVGADVQDLYAEKLSADGTSAEFRGVQEPMRVIEEEIAVKDAEPVIVKVRITRHGPLISDALNATSAASTAVPKPAPVEPLALRWTALDDEDTTVTSFMKLNEARNWDGFTAAMRDLNAPSQNFVYADVDGHIGYYAPGHIPMRAAGDGSRPVPGWSGDYEWTGWVPFEELPHLYDPPNHVIVTANNRPMPADYPHHIALEYPDPYRAQRITELLAGRTGLRPDDFRAIQADTRSLHAAALLPVLLPRVKPDPVTAPAIDILRAWDFEARPDSAAEAIFEAWFLRLAAALAGDELGPQALNTYNLRFSYVTRFVRNVATAGSSPWCDNVTTPAAESCDDTISAALRQGVDDLKGRLGSDPSRWRWDGVHRAVFPHQGLDAVAALRPILNRSRPNGGDWSTVNVGPVAADALYEQRSVPGYREIIDLSPANDSRFSDAVGESGHFLSPHYDDFLDDWVAVKHRKMRMDRADFENGARGRLTLTPAGAR